MTNPLTDRRLGLAALLRDELGDAVPVFPSPPNAPTPPCVILSMRGSDQVSSHIWSQELRVTVVGPSGDNEAATVALEDLALRLAETLSVELAGPVDWSALSQIQIAGQTCLGFTIDLAYEVAVQKEMRHDSQLRQAR